MTTNGAPVRGSRFGPAARGAQGRRQLWQVPTFFAGLLAVGVVSANVSIHAGSATPARRALAAARAILRDKSGPVEKARTLAAQALEAAGDNAAQATEAHFLLGLATLRLADQNSPEQARALRQEALTHLGQAEAGGVAEEDWSRLWYALGKTLQLTGGDPQRVVNYLRHALPEGADDPAEGYGLLAQAYLRLPNPNLEAALQANQKQLDLSSNEEIHLAARLARGELLARLQRYPEAVKILALIGPSTPAPARLRARFLQADCCEKAGLWGKAVPLWKELLATPAEVPGGKTRALYRLGLCALRAEPPDPQGARQAWKQLRPDGGEEGQAAALRLAELDLAGPAPDLAAALAGLKGALARVAEAKDYRNSLVDLREARQVFETALRIALETRDFEHAQRLADVYRRLAPPGVGEERFAAAAEAWANQLQERSRQASGDDADFLQEQARAQWRTAGIAAERAAEARGGDLSLLWRAVLLFRRGQDHDQAAAGLLRLVRQSGDRQAEAWFALAEVRRAQGHKDESRQAFLECTKFSSSPFAYKARYQLALERLAEKRTEEALDILEQNIVIINPLVEREAHEQSLYKLAGLLYQAHSYDKACVRLKQAVTTYPDNPQALAVRDQLGECYRLLAEQEKKKLEELADPVNQNRPDREEMRRHFEGTQMDWLSQGVETYQKLKEDLQARAVLKPLSPAEAGLLRKASFRVADLELERKNFTEAMRLYLQLARAYRKQVECLLACQGIGHSWNLLIKSGPQQARGVLDEVRAVIHEAQADLPAIPDAAFPPNTPSRETWRSWFQEFNSYIDRISLTLRKEA